MGLPDYSLLGCNKHGGISRPEDCPICKREYIDAIYKDQPKSSALNVQISGDHYKGLGIQPIEYIHANGIPFAEGCAIKYLTRWRSKGGIKDLEKARHFIDLLIELESKKVEA